MSFQQFPVRFGKYIILDRISAGGMAEVYRAKEMRDSGFSPVIAIKRMLPGIASEEAFAPMFVDEAKLASRLAHPNIAQTLELGRVDESLYIAMEMVWGRDLRNILKECAKRKQQMPVSLACYVVAKAAEALDFAHNALGIDGTPLKLVHRDVSPHNLMIDNDGAVKLIDFGVAKADVKSNHTEHGTIKGKFSYMAPEQVTGAPVDGRTDIFGLGIVLYEALSGERLYDGSSAFSIFDKVVNQPPPRLADSVHVPAELDAVVGKCLQKRKEERYDNASQLADALAPFLIHERSIVGEREAAQFLSELFPNDLPQMREKLQQYESITKRDCIDARDDVTAQSEYERSAYAQKKTAQSESAQNENVETRLYVPPASSTAPTNALASANEAKTPRARATVEIEIARHDRAFAIAVSVFMLVAAVTGAIVVKFTRDVRPAIAAVAPAGTPTEQPSVPAVGSPMSSVVPEFTPDPTPPAGSPVFQEPVRPTQPAQPAQSTPAQVAQPASVTRRQASRAKAAPVHPASPAPSPQSTADVGFISVGARGAAAKVYVDGREIGYAPIVAYKVKVGKHVVKMVPIRDEMPGTPSVQDIEVTKEHVQREPRRVFAEF